MTVVFSGNSYKYEAEAIVKLFLPAQGFDFIFEAADAPGDVCIIRYKPGKRLAYHYAYVRMGGRRHRLSETLPMHNADTGAAERTLCRLLYLCLQKVTGMTPAWGTLTGIRPVKRVNRMLDEGKALPQIEEELRRDFLVTPEKIQLAYRTAEVQRPLLRIPARSFSLYVSIPFCPSRCSYCSFVSHSVESAQKRMPEYLRKLGEEISLTAQMARELSLTLDTVYIGGGTPTSLEAEQLEQIMKAVRGEFNLSALREYTVEAGRADTITPAKLEVIRKNGADRISVNPQTMNDAVLRAIGRRHTARQVREAYRAARAAGFANINMDLIAGLPEDTEESFSLTLDEILELAPENITVHTLSLKRSSALFQGKEEVAGNPAQEMVTAAQKRLMENGYDPYYLYRQKNTLGNLENVGYSKPGRESLYNVFIMEEVQTILAVGAAGSTKLVDSRSGQIRRVFNYKFPYEYIDRFDLLMKKKKEIRDFYEE